MHILFFSDKHYFAFGEFFQLNLDSLKIHNETFNKINSPTVTDLNFFRVLFFGLSLLTGVGFQTSVIPVANVTAITAVIVLRRGDNTLAVNYVYLQRKRG